MPASYPASSYAAAERALMPVGRVWPNDPGTVQSAVLAALANEFETSDAAARALLVDSFPATAVDLLPEWEESLGLPDPCAGPNPTLQQRQAQVLARFTGGGGQSAQRFIDYAEALGFQIEITTYAPFRAGRSRAGQPVGGSDWSHAWRVTVIARNGGADFAAFRAGQARAGDALSSAAFSDAVLQCEFTAIAPAHTTIIFSV